MARLSLALLLVAAVGSFAQQQTCGSASYQVDQYNCFEGDILCPIINGSSTLTCGAGANTASVACYAPSQYDCVDGTLEPRTPQNDNLVRNCGSQPYEVSKYYCFDADTNNPLLCPVNRVGAIEDSTYVRCGQSCYLPTQFSCIDGQLNSNPAVGPTDFCRQEFDDCEILLRNSTGGIIGTTIVPCCGGFPFSCVADKCRNLTALAHGEV